jgi:hypothetical protein
MFGEQYVSAIDVGLWYWYSNLPVYPPLPFVATGLGDGQNERGSNFPGTFCLVEPTELL